MTAPFRQVRDEDLRDTAEELEHPDVRTDPVGLLVARQLLIERIDYDGGTGNLKIAFAPAGVRTLAVEAK